MKAESLPVLIVGLLAIGCRPEASAARADSAPPAAVAASASPSRQIVERYLELSREGHAGSRAALDSLTGCQIGDGQWLPIEMLAASHIVADQEFGDSARVRAEVTTVAEEDDGAPGGRYQGKQRIRTDTVAFITSRDGARQWIICSGPQYGFYEDPVTWEPSGASMASARRLADSIWTARRR